MKWLERTFNSIAKKRGYVKVTDVDRAVKVAFARSFKAASTSRLFADWTTTTTSADADARTDLVVARARARDVRKNYEYGKKFISLAVTNVFGDTGITLRNKAKDPDRVVGGKIIAGTNDIFANKQIEDAWWYWGKKENCTVSRKLCWRDVERIVLASILTDGEHLIRKVRGFDNDFKFAIQLLESDHLDVELNKDLGNGRKIVMGVEMDEWRAPIAYHVFRDNPNDWFSQWAGGSFQQRYYRIPAMDIIHAFLPDRANQTRGFPWLATALPGLQMLSAYEDAEVTAARVAASKMGFLKRTGDVQYQGPKDSEGRKFMDAEPGALEELPEGLDFQPWDPQHPNANLGSFIKTCLRRFAAGCSVSYNAVAEDMESVNFASGKLGLENERRFWRGLQSFMAETVCCDIFTDWLEAALMSWPGLATLPMSKMEKFNCPVWQAPGWSQIDPVKETAAIETNLRLGLVSPSEVIIASGRDPIDVWDQIKKDRDEMEAREIEPMGSFSDSLEKEAMEQEAEEPEPAPRRQ